MHADIIVRARKVGFDNLTPIFWHKITNASYEVENGSGFLGKPYEPNAIVKNDVEFILMLRKPGRVPAAHRRAAGSIQDCKARAPGVVPADMERSQGKIHKAPSGTVPGGAGASPREDVLLRWKPHLTSCTQAQPTSSFHGFDANSMR
jgi:hypothetical protein